MLPLVSPEAYPNPVPTEYVLRETAPHRDRLIPFCAIDPRNSWHTAGKKLVDQLHRYRNAGARGFGEHKPGLPLTDERNRAVYAACAEVGMPMLIHIDNRRNVDLPGLPGLGQVLRSFPDLTVVGHGPGWWASISGDARQTDLGGLPPRARSRPAGRSTG